MTWQSQEKGQLLHHISLTSFVRVPCLSCPHTVSTGIRWWTKMRQGKRTEKGEAARFLAFLVTLPSSRFQAMQCNEEQGRGKRRWEGRKKESHPSSLSLTHFPFPFHVMLGDLSHLNPKQWKGIEGNDW